MHSCTLTFGALLWLSAVVLDLLGLSVLHVLCVWCSVLDYMFRCALSDLYWKYVLHGFRFCRVDLCYVHCAEPMLNVTIQG